MSPEMQKLLNWADHAAKWAPSPKTSDHHLTTMGEYMDGMVIRQSPRPSKVALVTKNF